MAQSQFHLQAEPSALPDQYCQIVLNERPGLGPIKPTTFKKVDKFVIELKKTMKETDVLLQVDYCSLDPTMRSWINETRSYIEPVELGSVMRANSLSTVIAVGEKVQNVKVGDLVTGMTGWTQFAVLSEKQVQILSTIPPGATELDFLGALGATGMTAYFGLFDVAKINPGEKLVVSGAAGATGLMVCQFAKLVGARVYAITGSDEKCKLLEKEIGVDKALNYKSPNFEKDFQEHVGYLDVYFDNVGGEILDLCLTRLNKHARVALCGAVSAYNDPNGPRGLQGYMNLIAQSATIQGFVVLNYIPRFPEARMKIAQWIAEGKLKRKFYIQEGIENASQHLSELFEGRNVGKMVIHVSSKPNPKLD